MTTQYTPYQQRNLRRYWNFIKHVLKTNPAVTTNFKAAKRVIGGIYYDVHHIIPLEMGGTNSSWNLVYLSKKQHLFAHNILNRIFGRHNEVIKRLDYITYINDIYLMERHAKVSIQKWLNGVKNQRLAQTLRPLTTGKLDRKSCLMVLKEFVKCGAMSEYHKAEPKKEKKKK